MALQGIDMFDLWQSFQSTVNTFQGGWFRPQTDFQQKCNDISKSLWVKWTREAEKSQEAKDNLIFFLKSKNRIVKSQNTSYGIMTPPDDYGRFASARLIISGTTCLPCKDVDNGKCDELKTQEEISEEYYESICEIQVDLIDNQRWGSVCDHLTKKPTLASPKITQIDGGFKVSPRTVSVVVLDYYINPVDAVFAYTVTTPNIETGAGDQIVYNKSLSKPLTWPINVKNEFIIQLGEAYSYFTREQFWAQFNNQKKKEE